jgi:hypothetical protein
MTKKIYSPRRLPNPAVWVLVLVLYVTPLKRARAEERLDFKTMLYQEDDDRMRIIAPTFLYEHDLSPTLTIRLEGIYNSISGASPTGAPATPNTAAPSVRLTPAPAPSPQPPHAGGDDNEIEDRMLNMAPVSAATQNYRFKAGATPTPTPTPTPAPMPTPTGTTPAPSTGSQPTSSGSSSPAPASQLAAASNGKVPKANVEDERVGFNLSLIKRIGRHTPAAQLAYSTERDYTSLGVALTDAVDFNKKNTTLLYGGAYTHDIIDAVTMESSETKKTMDLLLGVTQLINPETFFTVNLTLSRADGFMTDPYKVVELNGQIVGEKRPDTKNKVIVFAALNHFFRPVDGAAELSYRWYSDSFGINANTVQLAWFQNLGRQFILSPSIRYYEQNAADFYDVRFTGDPDFRPAIVRIRAQADLETQREVLDGHRLRPLRPGRKGLCHA